MLDIVCILIMILFESGRLFENYKKLDIACYLGRLGSSGVPSVWGALCLGCSLSGLNMLVGVQELRKINTQVCL